MLTAGAATAATFKCYRTTHRIDKPPVLFVASLNSNEWPLLNPVLVDPSRKRRGRSRAAASVGRRLHVQRGGHVVVVVVVLREVVRVAGVPIPVTSGPIVRPQLGNEASLLRTPLHAKRRLPPFPQFLLLPLQPSHAPVGERAVCEPVGGKNRSSTRASEASHVIYRMTAGI